MSAYKLRRELLSDPLGIGYAALSDADCHASLNDDSQRPLANRNALSSAEIYEAIDRTEYQGLANAEKQELQIILGLGDNIDISGGSKARAALAGMFGGGSNTATALLAIVQNRTQSRYDELGIKQSIRSASGVAAARTVQA